MTRPIPPETRDPLFTVKDAAAYCRVSKSFLDKARVYGGGPSFILLGSRIRYRQSAIDAWMSGRTFNSTSQYKK